MGSYPRSEAVILSEFSLEQGLQYNAGDLPHLYMVTLGIDNAQ